MTFLPNNFSSFFFLDIMELLFFSLVEGEWGGAPGGGGISVFCWCSDICLLLGFVTAFLFSSFFLAGLLSCFAVYFFIFNWPVFFPFAGWRAFTSAHSKVLPLSTFSLHLYRWPFIIITIIFFFLKRLLERRRRRRRCEGGD